MILGVFFFKIKKWPVGRERPKKVSNDIRKDPTEACDMVAGMAIENLVLAVKMAESSKFYRILTRLVMR